MTLTKKNQRMRFLYNGDIAPLMDGVAFIKANIEECVANYERWLNKITKNGLEIYKVKGCLKDVVLSLPPLNLITKHLFIPTKSEWVAFTDNYLITPEIGRANIIASAMKAEVVHVVAWPRSCGKTVNGWGGGRFSMFDKNDKLLRKIELTFQDRWEITFYGEAMPFEITDKYKEKFVKDRFTPEMLDVYCKAIGIDFFNEDFYMPENSAAFLIEEKRDLYLNEEQQDLETARKIKGY